MCGGFGVWNDRVQFAGLKRCEVACIVDADGEALCAYGLFLHDAQLSRGVPASVPHMSGCLAHKTCDGDSLRGRKGPAMKLDPFQVVERVSGEVALAAVRADEDRHVLDDEKRGSAPVTAGHLSLADSGHSANCAVRSVDSGIMIRRHKQLQ